MLAGPRDRADDLTVEWIAQFVMVGGVDRLAVDEEPVCRNRHSKDLAREF